MEANDGCVLIYRLRASSKKSPISNLFSIYLVEKIQWNRELGKPIRVHLRVDVRSESGADYFYMLFNAPTLKCPFIEIEGFPVFTKMKQTERISATDSIFQTKL